MSGSSISREQPVEPLVERGAARAAPGRRSPRGPRGRPGRTAAARPPGGRMRSSCSATTSAIVWLRRRGVQEVGRDLGVEGDRRRLGRRVLGEPRDEERLDLVADERRPDPIEERLEAARRRPDPRRRPSGRPARRGPAPAAFRRAAAGRRGGAPRRPPAGRRATARGRRSPRPAHARSGRRVGDRGGQRGRQVGGGLDRGGRAPGSADRDRGDGDGRGGRLAARGRPVHRPEVERELEAAALPDQGARGSGPRRDGPGAAGGRGTRAGARQPVGRRSDLRRPDRLAAVDRAQGLDRLLGALAAERREPLDERPELVLAEEPDDRLAVVVAQAGRLEVQLDRQVADDRRSARGSRGPARGARGAVARSLLRGHLVDPLVERLEGAEGRGSAWPRSSRRPRARPGCCRSSRP